MRKLVELHDKVFAKTPKANKGRKASAPSSPEKRKKQ